MVQKNNEFFIYILRRIILTGHVEINLPKEVREFDCLVGKQVRSNNKGCYTYTNKVLYKLRKFDHYQDFLYKEELLEVVDF